MNTDNKYKVSKKQWNEWSPLCKHVFNEIYAIMEDQDMFINPETTPMMNKNWLTIRWNVAQTIAKIITESNSSLISWITSEEYETD